MSHTICVTIDALMTMSLKKTDLPHSTMLPREIIVVLKYSILLCCPGLL